MNRTIIICCLITGSMTLAMPFGTVSAQPLWKTCWSPDGEYIAYGDGTDIFIIDATGGEPVIMTAGIDQNCSCPFFSQDGSELIFSVIREQQDSTSNGTVSDIYAVDIEMGAVRTVLENAYALSFSQDGNLATFIKDGFKYAVLDFESGEEKVFDFFTYGPPYFCGGHSTLSPDNSYFVTRLEYGTNTPLWDKYKLYRISVDSGEAVMLETGEKNCIYPKYSPDGGRILFSHAGDDEQYRLAIYDLASGSVEPVEAVENAESMCGSWSPVSAQICCISTLGGRSGLYTLDLVTGEKTLLYPKRVDVTSKENYPLSIALSANYPNPFNLFTAVEFSLDMPGHVRLDVVNIMGQNIRRILSQDMDAGSYSVIWNGRDENGVTVSSGLYISRLSMGDQVTTRRMMLSK